MVGVYNTLAKTEAAVRGLDADEFLVDQISFFAKNIQDEKKVHSFVTAATCRLPP